MMSNQIEALFTTALGLQPPWHVAKVELDTAKRRIDFEVEHTGKRAACPDCGAEHQLIHDRVRRSWRHLDFFQFEAWLHADVPRIQCGSCGKTTQMTVPWAREGSGFTLLFEALGLSLCRELPVSQAANHLRVASKRLWRRIRHYVQAARTKDDMSDVRHVGVDETSVKRGHEYITVVHDLQAKRLLFACPGRGHETLEHFADDLRAHGGDPERVEHACIDMSAAYAKGIAQSEIDPLQRRDQLRPLSGRRAGQCRDGRGAPRRDAQLARSDSPNAGHGRQTHAQTVAVGHAQKPGAVDTGPVRGDALAAALELEKRASLAPETGVAAGLSRSARQQLRGHRSGGADQVDGGAKRSRLEPFKRLASTLKAHLGGVVRGMLDGRSNAYVEAMNGLLQQTKRAARGFSKHRELHLDRLSAHVQAQASTEQPPGAGHCSRLRPIPSCLLICQFPRETA